MNLNDFEFLSQVSANWRTTMQELVQPTAWSRPRIGGVDLLLAYREMCQATPTANTKVIVDEKWPMLAFLDFNIWAALPFPGSSAETVRHYWSIGIGEIGDSKVVFLTYDTLVNSLRNNMLSDALVALAAERDAYLTQFPASR